MKVTYLYHSGFLVEYENCAFLFDYIRGELPTLPAQMPLFVFSSHSHGDHFCRDIFRMFADRPNTMFILAKQIPMTENRMRNLGLTQKACLIRLSADAETHLMDRQGAPIVIKTLASTDMGVAFLVEYQNHRLYHAGDLNDWQWEEEDPAWNRQMHLRFRKQMEKLRGMPIYLAFAPLDPRQGKAGYAGLRTLLQTADVKNVIPMHMWGDYDIIHRWKQEVTIPDRTFHLLEIQNEGQVFYLQPT